MKIINQKQGRKQVINQANKPLDWTYEKVNYWNSWMDNHAQTNHKGQLLYERR